MRSIVVVMLGADVELDAVLAHVADAALAADRRSELADTLSPRELAAMVCRRARTALSATKPRRMLGA